MNVKNIMKIIENPIIQLLIGFSIIAFICYKCETSNSRQIRNEKLNQKEQETETRANLIRSSYDAAKHEMKSQLKSPSTAEFPSIYNDGSKYKVNDNGTVIIQAFVDSQNSFGATIRTNFRCTVSQTGSVSDLETW